MTIELLQQVRIINPLTKTDEICDVLIEDGYIRSVNDKIKISDIPENTSIRDCQSLILGPGLVDLYSHSAEPGFEERETIISLLKAAAAGGFTRITLLPDTSPAIDNPTVVAKLQQLRKASQLSPLPLLNIWGAITHHVKGEKITELADLKTAGVVGFADGEALNNLSLVRRVLEYLQPLRKPAAFWCCDGNISADGVMREGANSIQWGLPGIPVAAETSAIAALLEIVTATFTPIHIMRVSTARSVQLIADAKSKGLPITASTTWMHLLLDTKAIKSYNTALNLKSPLGNPEDMMALRRGVQQGIIDAIAIEHSPYTYEEKTVTFAQAPPGAIGLELALPLLWQNLVETGELTALELWKALSTNPAECLKQSPNNIKVGEKAELTLFNPQETWKVQSKNLHSLSINTPWLGEELKGKVVGIWC
ncbi:MAG: dihydroorotase [Richelia sp. RM2_1_2]|nr:dihydroorotase [Richelia sp. SM2_1_7]NJM21548.1 dihydroorotase [Richelia sp. SM1_7_0]NJN09196.1 dihydroorotase [Richelia sp. RM1_1_1]NJO28597.1 dihydroorotase [Richelia sp. SL_2_1]NJO61851.1 dihydroorotase [Richelia sp. RM2_1_2]